MIQNFPLFQSHIDLAHLYWQRLLQKGDWAIDATCGAGNDTLMLAKFILKEGNGGVIGIDIQEEAIKRTQELLETSLPNEALSRIHLFKQSHVDFPPIAALIPIKLIVYNLGYLPRGNKHLTTQTHSTLTSIEKALNLVVPGGALSITCYPGHTEGAVEEKALLEMAAALSPAAWNTCSHAFLNRPSSPRLILIQKNQRQTPL